jgi:hypothetical protein
MSAARDVAVVWVQLNAYRSALPALGVPCLYSTLPQPFEHCRSIRSPIRASDHPAPYSRTASSICSTDSPRLRIATPLRRRCPLTVCRLIPNRSPSSYTVAPAW